MSVTNYDDAQHILVIRSAILLASRQHRPYLVELAAVGTEYALFLNIWACHKDGPGYTR